MKDDRVLKIKIVFSKFCVSSRADELLWGLDAGWYTQQPPPCFAVIVSVICLYYPNVALTNVCSIWNVQSCLKSD